MNYIDVTNHSLARDLSLNYLEIKNEFYNLIAKYPGTKPNNLLGEQIDQKESNGKMLYQGKIKSVFTRVVPESCSKTEYESVWGTTEESKILADLRLKKKQELCPKLEEILSPYHPYIGSVGFNLMSPGTKLSMHYGMVSKYIRFHLGLVCDPQAKFLVNNSAPRSWQCGLVWAFDDGLSYHGTVHQGTTERLILLVDLERSTFSEIKEEIYQ